MRRALRLLLVSGLVASLAAPASGGGAADSGASTGSTSSLCMSGHGRVFLGDFVEPQYPTSPGFQVRVPAPFYHGVEGGTATATIRPTQGCGDADPSEIGRVRGVYQTAILAGATAEPADFTPIPQMTGDIICEDVHPDLQQQNCGMGVPRSQGVPITLAGDGIAEPAIEFFHFQLTNGIAVTSGGGNGVGGVAFPSVGRVFVADLDGARRATLEPGAQTQLHQLVESPVTAWHIPAFRAGPDGTEPRTATFTVGGLDPFPATPGADFSCTIRVGTTTTQCGAPTGDPPVVTGTISFGAQRVAYVVIRAIHDTEPEEDESLRITLASGGTLDPVDQLYTTLRIQDNDAGGGDVTPPTTKFHHPRHGKKYKYGAYQIREFHVFYTKDPSEILKVQIALRRKMTSGKCGWWNGKKFVGGKCGAKRWIDAKYYRDLDWYYLRLPVLKPTVGTKVRAYRAWSRAIDGAFNAETSFEVGRNSNAFKVKRRT